LTIDPVVAPQSAVGRSSDDQFERVRAAAVIDAQFAVVRNIGDIGIVVVEFDFVLDSDFDLLSIVRVVPCPGVAIGLVLSMHQRKNENDSKYHQSRFGGSSDKLSFHFNSLQLKIFLSASICFLTRDHS
jgi:hypothetical protein